MKPTIIFALLLGPLLGQGQIRPLTDEQVNMSGMIKLVFVQNVSQADSLARVDIKNGTPFLLLQSGISPVFYPADTEFENKYNIYFNESGCTGPKLQFAETYNIVTFEHLTSVYGRKWIKELRKDVIGFKKWRRTRR